MKKIIVILFALALIAGSASATDTLRVIRSGKLVQTSSPSLTTGTFSSYVTANKLVIPSGGSIRINNGVNTSTITNNMPVRTVTVNVSGTNYYMILRTYK